MARPKNTATRTCLCSGRLKRGTDAHELLRERRVKAAAPYDAALDELGKNHPGETLDGNRVQLIATAVAREQGISRGTLNSRCRIATAVKSRKITEPQYSPAKDEGPETQNG